jgi:flagellar basal-body rod modification protein FlgD
MYVNQTTQTAAAGTSSTQAATGQTSQAKDTAASDALGQKEVFLQLLVAQIRNQNPLNPADGIQFVTQLAQFSQLEETIQMRTDLDAMAKVISPPANGSGGQDQTGKQNKEI